MLALARTILLDPPGRRPHGRRLRAGVSEADGMHLLLRGAELALMVFYYALCAGQDDAAISRDGVDPVARAVLDAGGHVAVAQFKAVARVRIAIVPAAMRSLLDLCEPAGAAVLGLLVSRPRGRAAIMEAIAAAERQRAAAT